MPQIICFRAIVFVSRPVSQHQEFVPAVAVIMPVGIQMLQDFAGFPQQCVSGCMPVLIVDFLEIVDVNHINGQVPAKHSAGIRFQRHPVQQAGQCVVAAHIPQGSVILLHPDRADGSQDLIAIQYGSRDQCDNRRRQEMQRFVPSDPGEHKPEKHCGFQAQENQGYTPESLQALCIHVFVFACCQEGMNISEKFSGLHKGITSKAGWYIVLPQWKQHDIL